MTRRQISSGSKFEAEIGYSRAIVDGDMIWVSGTTGFNYEAMTISEDVVEQADQTFRNIKAAMEKAGFSLADVVSATYIFPRAEDFEPCWPVFRKYLGETRPAATAIIAALIDPRMKIEIQVTGKKLDGSLDRGRGFAYQTSHRIAGVAQLVRASACHAEGRRFEPGHSRHSLGTAIRFPSQSRSYRNAAPARRCAGHVWFKPKRSEPSGVRAAEI